MPNFYKHPACSGRTAAVVSGAVAALLLLPGCGKQAPPPPTERLDLVARFFASVKSRDFNAAMRQGVKLRSLDSHNENIARLVEIQQCNAYVGTAQKLVNEGDIRGAVSVLEKGVKRYPDNITLREILPRVRQLRNAKNLINGMRQASNAIAMRSALTAARIGLAANETPALRRYFAAYEKQIAEVEKQEKIREENRARAEAAEKAKTQTSGKNGQAAAEKNSASNGQIRISPAGSVPSAASQQKPSTVPAEKK